MNEFLKKDDKLMRNDLTAYDYKSGKLYGTNGAEINNDSINVGKKLGEGRGQGILAFSILNRCLSSRTKMLLPKC